MTHPLLREHLKARPWAFALWRYSELVPLARLDFPAPLLDLGCGDGLFASGLFPGQRPFGIDRDPPSLQLAQRAQVYRGLVRADLQALPVKDGRFATVFANCVVEHVAEPERMFREVARVLRPGGRFVFTVPSERYKQLLFWPRLFAGLGLAALARRYGDLINRLLVQHHLLSAHEWGVLLGRAGLRVLRAEPYASPLVAALFDLGIPPAVPAFLLRELTRRWHVLPKGRLAAAAIEKVVGAGTPTEGAGILLEAVRS